MFGANLSQCVGLTFACYGGYMLINGVPTLIGDQSIALTASTTNYIERTLAGLVSKNTTGFTAGQVPLYTALTSTVGITPLTPYRNFVAASAGLELPVAGGSKRFLTYPGLASLTDGTDTTPVNGTRYWSSILIPHVLTLTGIAYLIGTVGGTNNVIVELKNAAGVTLASSAAAGVTVGTLATFQLVPFIAPVTVPGPAWYYLVLQFNGTTARFRTMPANLGISQTAITGSAAGTFGTLAAITPGSTFTAGVGPIAHTY